MPGHWTLRLAILAADPSRHTLEVLQLQAYGELFIVSAHNRGMKLTVPHFAAATTALQTY